jgi:formylglycine-generating enzyme required for sulfatase activity
MTLLRRLAALASSPSLRILPVAGVALTLGACSTPYFGGQGGQNATAGAADEPSVAKVTETSAGSTTAETTTETTAEIITTPAVALEPLTLPIAGTSVTLEMRPIAGPTGSFYAATTEATWDLYDAFIFNLDTDAGESTAESDAVTRPSKPYVLADRGYGHADFAALSISPAAAEQFVEWLSVKTGRTFRIPTVAEQEHLLRSSGVTAEALPDHGWFEENADYSTHEVATKTVDANGLYDVWGNVSEYAKTPEGTYIVLGGSFIDPVADVSLDWRHNFTPDWNADDPQVPKSKWWLASNDWVGLRLVCDP